MTRFSLVTLFPEMFESVLGASMLGRARDAGLLSLDFVNPRDFTSDRHRTADDTPYGGGPGMVMKPEPLVAAIESLGTEPPPHRILLTPVGPALTQQRVRELAALPHIALVCGRYEGIDERVAELCIDERVSIGDFVLTGGEIPAMALIDAVARHVPGVLGAAASAEDESFSQHLLEYPQYTRPAEFRGLAVPEVLTGGHHGRIEAWRRAQSVARTAAHRPDLIAAHYAAGAAAEVARRTYLVLAHHPVYDRNREVVTSSVTNLDIHDIARSAATYGLGGYLPVTPVSHQQDKIERIVSVWRDQIRQAGADNRGEALASIEVAPSIAGALARVARRHKKAARPLVVATSARDVPGAETVDAAALRGRLLAHEGPAVLLFGTGWGLTEEALGVADLVLEPVRGPSDFNHLSVRSAAAAVLDRLFGL